MTTPVWDVTLQRTLRSGPSVFRLDLRWTSPARRLVLHGPSGAGKTQTLRMLAGLATPDAGRVVVDGRTLLDRERGIDLAPRVRRMPVVFQDYALFPHLTVRQNIAFALGLGGPLEGRAEQVQHWIGVFRLDGIASLRPHQISGGQRQRTALARALVASPRALLLDEPFAAVDVALRRHLREELLALQQSLDLPMLLVTHEDEDLRHFAQDAVELIDGRATGSAPLASAGAGEGASADGPASR